MAEYDAILMSVLIFLPMLFALGLLFFPRGTEEYMRWWTLLGTAATLVVSLWVFIDYRSDVSERFPGENAKKALLGERMGEADRKLAEANGPRETRDWTCKYPWIERFNITYALGLDGISLPLVLLTTVISFLGMLASWPHHSPDDHGHHQHWATKHVRGYCVLFLLLETGMLGTFLSLDFFLFYIFWEIMLLPMYFLIGVWGGPRREYAAIKFFLYTLLGSVFILIAMLGFYFTDVRDFVTPKQAEQVVERAKQANPTLPDTAIQEQATVNTFDLMTLAKVGKVASEHLTGEKLDVKVAESRLEQPFFSTGFQTTMFLLLLIGFAIKVPSWPFHTWLPDAHVEAPTPISMILAGVLLKMGGYGILRIAYPICPWAAEHLAWWVALFGIISIVYGAFAAMAQTDFKKLVAYSSVSHMGYVTLGIAVWAAAPHSQFWAWGMNGAMFQMIAHGITSAGMFFLVGVIYDRAHHRNLDNFRGLFEPMPLYGGLSAVVFFAAMGLPGMCGFVGEFMVVLSTWYYSKPFAVLAALTVVLTAAYILWTMQRVFLGTNPAYKNFRDITLRELLCVVPLIVLAVLLGVLPRLLLDWMEPSVTGLVDTLARLGR